ncbi:MAG: hypothetical protein ABEJ59_04050 [Halanaeroarchaeum sp.]
MVFENVTMVELHLHTGEEDETPDVRPTRRVEVTEESPSKPSRVKRSLLVALALTVVSVAVSVGVTLAVRRFRGGDAAETDEE